MTRRNSVIMLLEVDNNKTIIDNDNTVSNKLSYFPACSSFLHNTPRWLFFTGISKHLSLQRLSLLLPQEGPDCFGRSKKFGELKQGSRSIFSFGSSTTLGSLGV